VIHRTSYALPDAPITSLDDFIDGGGLTGLLAARSSDGAEVIDVVGAAGIRGRGGAGLPTGRKWRSLAESATAADRAFVVVNAAEGEPGTFKDRALLRANPYIVLEGALIAAHCIGAERVVVATKAKYGPELAALRRAIGELDAGGWTVGIDLLIVEGPDHYLFGEETALLEVIEGEDPLPRHLPPYHYGLFTTSPQLGWSAGTDDSPGGPSEESSNPALVNNAETYAHAALVCRHGADWYRSLGTPESPGFSIVTLTGDVQRAVVAEVELGQPLDEVILELSGGAQTSRRIKAVLSGVSNPVLASDKIHTAIGYETLAAVGGGMGSAGFIIYDDRRNLVDVAYQVSRFLHVESCGQCNPCKTGTHDITAVLEHLVAGTGSPDETVATIERRMSTVTDAARCYLPTQERLVVASLLMADEADLAARLGSEAGDLDVPLPKLVDIANGVAELDPRADRKRPDWTYAESPVRLTS
jgi:NADH:ubiquinone oxidoreductase subunit F (NADH-binding)